MSENIQQNKNPASNKGPAKGLGRGLGSLLSGENGAFAASSPGADKTLEALTSKLPGQKDPAIQQGFIESKPAATSAAPVAATVAPSPTASALAAVAAAPAPQPAAPAVPNHLRIWQVGIEKIQANPNQPRQIFEKDALQELANSIQEKGIIQPLLLRKRGEGFEIIAGERRWRAAQLAGLKEVPALIKESEDQEVLELALIENIQRENLNPIEEAEAYDYLIKKYNLTQQELAQKVGKERATVANLLRLLGLTPAVRQMVSKNELSLGQAKVLLAIGDGIQQQQVAEKARNESLSVRALEKLVQKPKAPDLSSELSEDEQLREMLAKDLGEEIQKLLGSKVVLDYSKGKGKIAINFYSDAELNQIADKLRNAWQN